MKLQIIFTGRTTGTVYPALINEYVQRLTHYVPTQIEEIPDLKNTKNLSQEQQKEREADQVLERLQPGDVLVLLDERGREMTSREFRIQPMDGAEAADGSQTPCAAHRWALRLLGSHLRSRTTEDFAFEDDILPSDGTAFPGRAALSCLYHHSRRALPS